MQNQCFLELEDFDNFARYVCALREYPLRVYSHELEGKMVLSSGIVLSNTLVFFYTHCPKSGRYVACTSKGGKEHCEILDSTKTISNYAPVIHLDSLPSPFKIKSHVEDEFKPIKVKDLGSLARITYDPDLPEEPDVTLFLFPHKKKWILGKITFLEMDEIVYCFNYVELDNEPTKPYLKYQGHEGKEPDFADKFQHGYLYLPIIRLKHSHPIFGLN